VPTSAAASRVFDAYDLQTADRDAMLQAMNGVFSLRRMRSGQSFSIDRLFDGRIRRFEYDLDNDWRVVVRRDGEGFVAKAEPIEKQVTIAAVEGRIDSRTPSLTQALDAVGERIDLALQLANVFSGEIDFSSELQPGDHFRLVVERQSREGTVVGYGAILAAEFVASDRVLHAYRFAADGGTPGYYDDKGQSLKRFFLKSPLKFEPRITSRFSSARRHPILDYTRAHNGVDFHAPSGAPVVSVAPGVVTLAGWTNGGGRTVRIRHANGYESEYLHLSAIGVRLGTRVGQGELVGKVGATGLATGPHLHYGLRKNGSYVNPVTEQRNMPPGDPVPAERLASFTSTRERFLPIISSLRMLDADN
jgi:murein DD-endopeptidase MepM/ murein hydrolase activator NlpD